MTPTLTSANHVTTAARQVMPSAKEVTATMLFTGTPAISPPTVITGPYPPPPTPLLKPPTKAKIHIRPGLYFAYLMAVMIEQTPITIRRTVTYSLIQNFWVWK